MACYAQAHKLTRKTIWGMNGSCCNGKVIVVVFVESVVGRIKY